MKFGRVPFDLNRFGGTRPLAEIRRLSDEKIGVLPGSSVPSVPSVPSQNQLFILEAEGRKTLRKRGVGKTIGNAGDTRDTGDRPFQASDYSRFRFAAGAMVSGDVCEGWSPESWACELRRMADRCDAYRPDIATYYRHWAGDIESRLGAT